MPLKDPIARKEYQKKRSRAHYLKNAEHVKARTKKNRVIYQQTALRWIYEYLLSHPCVDCLESDPIVLEFDHREGTEKVFNIADATSGRVSLDRIKEEVEKCDVRCANCHRRMTYSRAKRTHRGVFVYGGEELILTVEATP